MLAFVAGLSFAGSASAQDGLQTQPLANRSGPRGATLFAPVAPEESGIRTENNYADPEMWGRRSREFDLGGIGTGIAIGDYDGDGRPDLFTVSKTESCRLFRNLGEWRFEDVTEAAGVGDDAAAARIWKQGATFADVNNDGWLDIYLCRFNAPNRLYINQGDGTFLEQAQAAGLDLKDASIMAAFGDYDRDGWLDAFVQTNVLDATAAPEGQRDRLYRNNRDGTFTDVTDQSGVGPAPTHGNSALWLDFDDDGWPDLYVANDFAVADALYRNNGDGTFTNIIAGAVPSVPYSSMGSDMGDVDNDGRIDLLVADMAATTHVKDQRTMAETRARMKPPAEGSAEVRQFPYSTLFLNTGTGRCIEAAHLAGLAATDWTWSPRWEDLDNDGRLDLHVTNGMYREIHNQDLISKRMMAGSPAAGGQVVRNSAELAESNLAFRNLGELRFENVSAAWGLDHTGVSFGSALGDLDGDGDLDLVYGNYRAGVTVLRNDSDTGHRVVCVLRGTQSNPHGIGAKVTLESASGVQVRLLGLARGFMSSSEPIVHFGIGDDTTIRRLSVRWPSGVVQTVENIAADQRLILTEPRSGPAEVLEAPSQPQFTEIGAAAKLNSIAREEPYDEFLDQRLLPASFNRRGPAIAVGDLHGQGRDSVVIGGTTLDPLRIAASEDRETWKSATPQSLASPPWMNDGPVLVFDASGDGHPDLLVAAGGASQPDGAEDYQPRLYWGDGHGGFAPAPEGTVPALAISTGAACAADFDRDGRLDVFLGGRLLPGRYPATPQSALLANQGGRFADVTDEVAAALRTVGMVTGAIWSDVDGDTWPDLLVALEWGHVRYFHNEYGKRLEDWSDRAGFTAAGTGWWRGLAAADFNGDGRPDFAVGNLGLNTPYRGDASHPVMLFAGNFGGRAAADLIEAYHDGDTLYPRRSRTDLGAALPALLRRYRWNNDYAAAALPDILGAEPLAAATRLEATQLQGGVFLSGPEGTYRFAPWPRLAQVAPANGLVAGDFDGDGCADLYVLHNSHAPAAAHGRFDAGLSQFLRGDGRGGFQAVPAAESGLVVPGDAKALAVIDLGDDGWPDLLASRNNDTLLAFRNHGIAGRRSVRVVLQGRPGNPQAIGARVIGDYSDGSTRIVDVHAGSGYYSQSTAAQFLGSTVGNPLRQVRVRWPSGAESSGPDWSTFDNLPSTVRLAEPADALAFEASGNADAAQAK